MGKTAILVCPSHSSTVLLVFQFLGVNLPLLSMTTNWKCIGISGAESIFQTLRAQRPLVVVLNKQLLGKYGLELAKQLAKFMYCCSPETLVETLSVMDLEPLLPYPPHPPPFNVVADLINSLSNFLSDNEALAPFQDGANAAVPTPESDIAVPKPEISEEPTSGLRKSPTMRKAQNPEGRT